MESIGNVWWYTGFAVFVVVALAIDLVALDKKAGQKVGVKEAINWSLLWFGLSFVFAAGLWWYLDGSLGREIANVKTTEFLTGYLIEKSLGGQHLCLPDDLHLFCDSGRIPAPCAGAGRDRRDCAACDHDPDWCVAHRQVPLDPLRVRRILLITGIKMLVFADEKPDLEKNPVLKWMRSHMNISRELSGENSRSCRMACAGSRRCSWCWC